MQEHKITTNYDENGKILNSLFFNLVKHLKIPEFKAFDFSSESMPHPALNAIKKFCNHLSVCATSNAFLIMLSRKTIN